MHKSGRHIPDHIPIVQELVRDTRTEYGFRGLGDNGTLLLTCQKRQIRGISYAGGASVFRETMRDPRIEELGRTILEHLDWHGLASVQFLKDPDSGEYKFTEINPRVWASLEMDVLAGADFPYAHWLLATGNADRIETEYELGTGNHLLIGELRYLQSVLRDHYPLVERPKFRSALWDVLSSCYDQPHFDYIHLDDPRPFVRGVLNQVPIGHRPTGEIAGQ
jgi:predicted ATP-grasp superfamily ATP-dependent carboligase